MQRNRQDEGDTSDTTQIHDKCMQERGACAIPSSPSGKNERIAEKGMFSTESAQPRRANLIHGRSTHSILLSHHAIVSKLW